MEEQPKIWTPNSYTKPVEEPPLDTDGKPKLKFEERLMARKNGVITKAIGIGGEWMSYEIDMSSLMDAAKMGPHYFHAAKRDIQKHFAECVSEFLGRRVTTEEVANAVKTGWI